MFQKMVNALNGIDIGIISRMYYAANTVRAGYSGPNFTNLVGRPGAYICVVPSITNIDPTTGIPDTTSTILWQYDRTNNIWTQTSNSSLIVTDTNWNWNQVLSSRWDNDCSFLYLPINEL